MKEIDILHGSPFLWIPFKTKQPFYIAVGFDAWGGIFFKDDRWYAIGGLQKQRPRLLAVGEKAVACAAANDWMNLNESDDTAHKAKKWVNRPATEKQLAYLPEHRGNYALSRYKASALLTLKFNAGAINQVIGHGEAGNRSFMREMAYG